MVVVAPVPDVPSPKSHAYSWMVVPGALVDADPLKNTVWPTAGEEGEKEKLAVGAVADTVIVLAVVAVCPRALLTVKVTVYVTAWANRCVGVTPEPLDPSPKSQLKVPSLGLEATASKKTS